MDAGDYVGARDVLHALDDGRDELGVRFRRARLALVFGDYATAADAFRRLVDEGHPGAALAHDLAFARICLRDLEGADEAIGLAMARSGDSVELAVLRARIALLRRDYAAAD